MVKFSDVLKLRLVSRTLNSMEVELPTGKREKYLILAIFPFSSETKSMGIVVRHEETKRIIFYLKGADSVIQHKVIKVYKSFLLDEAENLAREGLRTLVMA